MTAKSAAAAARATVYGYPRQGQNRELKKAIDTAGRESTRSAFPARR
ncbi:hypothetical protein HEP84_10680 [Streptomyces sp. RLB1-33]|nr:MULTISPECIES: hypothetical protein [Streptomyces]QIY67921.1 hypothetical protein HEP84_10680 [Streptomyces sp. RLB1-33]QUW85382.1 hypothetical protein SMIR_34090 [Streptomyces mirabilis]